MKNKQLRTPSISRLKTLQAAMIYLLCQSQVFLVKDDPACLHLRNAQFVLCFIRPQNLIVALSKRYNLAIELGQWIKNITIHIGVIHLNTHFTRLDCICSIDKLLKNLRPFSWPIGLKFTQANIRKSR